MTMKEKEGKAPDLSQRSSSKENGNNYDPYEQDPGAGSDDDARVNEADERKARQREGIHLSSAERLDDSATAPLIHTGIAGQTSRGSYGFDAATGQGAYMDRTRDGSADVAADPIDQPADRFGAADGTIESGAREEEEIKP